MVRDSGKNSLGGQRGFSVGPEHDLAFYGRRFTLCGAIAISHILLLVVVLYSGRNVKAPAKERRLAVIDVSAAQEPSTPARPAKTPQISPVKRVELLPSEMTVPMLPAASGSGDGAGCAMTAAVARAIAESPEAMAALAALKEVVLAALACVVNEIVTEPGDRHSLTDLARAAGTTTVGLVEKFRSMFGHTPFEYVQRVRVDAAKIMLEGTKSTVKYIAGSVRFASRSHFPREFSRITGQDPTRFRKLRWSDAATSGHLRSRETASTRKHA